MLSLYQLCQSVVEIGYMYIPFYMYIHSVISLLGADTGSNIVSASVN